MRLNSNRIFLFVLLLADVLNQPVFAEATNDQHAQSLSIELVRTNDVIQVSNQTVDISPVLLTVFYQYQWNESWMLSSSIWTGEDSGRVAELESFDQTHFEEETSGISATFSLQLIDWSWDFGASFSRGDAEVRADNPRFITPSLREFIFVEDSQSSDFFVTAYYPFDWQNISVMTRVSLGYQKSEINTTIDAMINKLPIRERVVFGLDGGYVAPGLVLSYLLEGSNEILWQPSVSIAWTQTLWGDAVSHSNLELRSNQGLRRKTSEQSEGAKSGSGDYSVALLMLLDDYSAELSFRQAFSTDLTQKSIGLLLGLNF